MVALLLMTAYLLAGIFGPMPRYQIRGAEEIPENSSDSFLLLLESLVDAVINRSGTLRVFTNGPEFYPAILDAFRSAQHSVSVEAYIFQKGEIARQYVEVLAERARAGVQVNLVLDAFGSLGAPRSFFRPLVEAGGRVERYNRLTWYAMLRMDHRTHRELVIVDGKIGFIGGAGVADQWFTGVKGRLRWRDTMIRVEGAAVPNLQATFAENWLQASGELLAGKAFFPDIDCPDPTTALVINSTPTVGGSTRARILMQILLASARRSISITTPYFLPDKSLMRELCAAVERGVKVQILVPGTKSDHMLTRSTSRGGYGELLKAGAEVYEYQPSMIHAKVLIVDELWAVVGSTNFDNRSFGINDEVNLAVRDRALALRLAEDNAADLRQSQRITVEDWRHRPLTERATELLGWVIERQQ
ncbi:cardiolipin synthase B [Acidobacteria bacterium AB60]|nr:cardiolipin synthase B [Acidobacteria bacterium AB60]